MGKRERKDSIGNSSKKEEKKAKKKKEKKEKKKHRSSTGSDGKSKHHQNGQKIQESGEKSHPVVSQDESKKSPDKKRRKTSGMAAAAPGTVAISQVTNRGNNNSYKKAFILKKKIVLAISLLPGALRNSQKAVENNIARLLFKNTPGIGGIMLSYANLKFSKSKNTSGSESAQSSGHGWILNELPYIHFDVSCDMMVFRPFVGCEVCKFRLCKERSFLWSCCDSIKVSLFFGPILTLSLTFGVVFCFLNTFSFEASWSCQ